MVIFLTLNDLIFLIFHIMTDSIDIKQLMMFFAPKKYFVPKLAHLGPKLDQNRVSASKLTLTGAIWLIFYIVIIFNYVKLLIVIIYPKQNKMVQN